MPSGVLALVLLAAQPAAASTAQSESTPRPATSATVALLEPCVECHGNNGIGRSAATPHLNGQIRSYLVESIAALASGKRATAVPQHIPPTLAGEQIALIAAQYSAASPRRPREATDADKVAVGRGVYLERCIACHVDEGRETDDKGMQSPLLAGQKAAYLGAQIRAFASGRRAFSATMMRRAFAGEPLILVGKLVRRGHGDLSERELDGVAHFFAAAPSTAGARRRGPPR